MASTWKPNQSVKLTKTVIDAAPIPSTGQVFLRDSELKGFGLRITNTGARSFIIEKRIDGRVRRTTIARYGELTAEQARKQALKFLGQVATGINPIAEKERERVRRITLKEAFEDFLKARKELKPRTLYDYQLLITGPLGDWQTRPLCNVTKDMVAKRHAELGKKSGEAYANLTMRFLRSVFNFAMAHYEDGFGRPLLTENPVIRLTQTRAWYRAERRQTVIKVHELKAWYRAVDRLKTGRPADRPTDRASSADTVADYLLTLLLTGLRRQEAARLTWEYVDLKDRTLTIPDPKNRAPHTLPLSDYLVDLLAKRRVAAESAFVFAGDGRQGYLIEPKRKIAKVIAESGVSFTLHDLRRTFITVAEAIDTPPYAIKRLVNHKMRNDVTAGYIVADTHRLRQPMQRITEYLLRAMGAKTSAQVLALDGQKKTG